MNQPKVSVIIPVYNVEKHLDRCVESVVNQTYQNLEVVLVDDGSPDNCPQMCDEWAMKDCRIKVIHKENAGAGLARNTGLENATGEYVTFVDSDDYIDKRTVSGCVSVLQKHKSDMVMYGRVNVDQKGNESQAPVVTDKLFFANDEIMTDVLPGLFTNKRSLGIGVCGKVIKSDIIKKNGVKFQSEREILSEDAFFLLELFGHLNAVSILPECYYYYVRNENSFTHTFKKKYRIMNDSFLTKSMEICRKNCYPETVLLHIKAKYLVYALSGMKQVLNSDLPDKDKKKELMMFMENQLLRKILTANVIKLNSYSVALFWVMLKMRLYALCRAMLKFKTRK